MEVKFVVSLFLVSFVCSGAEEVRFIQSTVPSLNSCAAKWPNSPKYSKQCAAASAATTFPSPQLAQIDNRNILFEKMAQIAVFPCSFSECGEKLAWGEVEKHEENCEHRTIRCPVSWKCEEVISVDNLIPHCSVGHRKNVCNESLVNPIDILLNGKKKFTVLLLIKETTPFLVFTTTTSQNIWINVFSLYPHDAATYKLELMSSANECCLSFLNKINPYHPRKHCKRCALKECPDDLHVPAVLELDEYLAEIGYQKVNRDLVTELDLKELRYTVDLNGKLPAECQLCPDIFDFLEGHQENTNVSCSCEDPFYDVDSQKCVKYLDCPIFHLPDQDLLGTDGISNILKGVLETLFSGGMGDFTSKLANLLSKLPVGPPNGMDSEDVRLVRMALGKNLGGLFLRITTNPNFLRNPFISGNSRVKKTCGNDHLCMIRRFSLGGNKSFQQFIADLVPEILDGLIGTVGDLGRLVKFCKGGECRYVRFLVVHGARLRDMLSYSKDFGNNNK
ncbi:hypothetical protein JTB14_034050 [Gonioctena quinquepunctata]|nr:hypothetical protein JTB14_034050 [Gonioctena quinquepunctata]